MKTRGASLLKKVSVLLAVLLCGVLTLALPVVSFAAPSDSQEKVTPGDVSQDTSFALTCGEISSGEPEAVLQLDKTGFAPLLQRLLQVRYPEHTDSPAVPTYYSYSKRECSLSSILSKGP